MPYSCTQIIVSVLLWAEALCLKLCTLFGNHFVDVSVIFLELHVNPLVPSVPKWGRYL
jgi:hypothetical protein